MIAAPALLLSANTLLACGPWFPNNMLDRGDAAVFVAPVADFYHQLDRMQFQSTGIQAVAATNGFSEETMDAETADLRAALKKSGKSDADAERIVLSHLAERGKLQKFCDALEQWKAPAPEEFDSNGVALPEQPKSSQPAFPSVSVVAGLPAEFADYFEGAIAWRNPNQSDKSSARQAWERILNRPANERQYKSTWAAFMLGRSWQDEDPQKARDYYKQVRDLAAQGFSDPTGLAATSLGDEARVALRENDFDTAINLYLQQYAADGWGSGESLQVALGRAVHAGPAALKPLALDPQARRAVTAYLISERLYDDSTSEAFRANTKAWLEAVEQANVTDVESAEQFALAAYQADEMELAARWVNRAPTSPTAQWVAAKLLLHAGKVDKATVILTEIVDRFPTEADTNDTSQASASLENALFMPDDEETVPAGHYIRGELGALQLSRREYAQALDLFIRGDFWTDAAYVADRVLTTDELKSYVDENWPAIVPSDDPDKTASQKKLEENTTQIRYLLARRLTRESHGPEARAYFPAEQLPAYDALMQALNDGWSESLPTEQRAKALQDAAFMACTNGMELLATEGGPDWHIFGGDFEDGVTVDSRTNGDPVILIPSEEELKRNADSKTDPDKRYHYRYQASALAWEATKLMPDNSDETARLLCDAGSWIKAQDPQAADLFYKTLVRRCGKTEIGAEADEIRWFPRFDADGNLIRPRLETLAPPTSAEIASADAVARYPIPGKYFLVQSGDHIRYMASAVRRLGISMTAKEIFAANPEFTPNDDITGRLVFIPVPGSNAARPPEPVVPQDAPSGEPMTTPVDSATVLE